MPSANGHGPKPAVLYCRVSTQEQSKGYSLAQQLEALRAYCATEGYDILEEVTDPGHSGASIERPGMDFLRDLVAAGDVSVVLAQDRDRFAREPAYLYLLKQEFAEYGTKIRALNDRGDDSPEGELMDGVFDQFAKFERAKTAERTRRGKLQKVRQGKLLAAAPRPKFGFRYNEARDGLVVDEETMPVVQRIFRLLGEEGAGLHGVRRALEQSGVPAPNGGRRWSRATIRNIVLDDCYKPHTYSEVEGLVAPEVAARLDKEKRYGIWWFNRRRNTVRQVAESGPEGKRYRKRYKARLKPREEWIAVPIEDASVSRELVDAARDAIENNARTSSAGERFWGLSGGIFVCGECGCRMLADRQRKRSTPHLIYHYYRCPTRKRVDRDACPVRQSAYRAEKIEERVWQLISGLLKDPAQLRDDLDAMIELRRNDIARGNPKREAKAWLEKLAELDRKRSGYIDLAAEGIIDRDELRAKLAALEETRQTARLELEALDRRQQEIAELERDRDTLLDSLEAVAPEVLDALAPEERHHVYKMLQLRVYQYRDGTLEASWAFGKEIIVWNSEITCS